MEANIKNAYIEEVTFQTKMLNRLKRWLKNMMFFSSISLILIMFGPSFHSSFRIIGIIIISISILSSISIGLVLKKGRDNINKILDIMQNQMR